MKRKLSDCVRGSIKTRSINLYKSKKIPWRWVAIRLAKYRRSFFFVIDPAPKNHWMHRPRFFAWVNLFFVSCTRDNSGWRAGIGIGKRHVVLVWHIR